MGDWRRGGLLALAAGLTASMPLVAQESYTLGGPEVAIYNLAGRAEIVRGSGSEVRVTLVRGGRDADELQVESGRVEGRETLRVLYPDDNIIYDGRRRGSTDVRVRDDGTFYDEGRGGRRVRVRSSGRGLEAWADLRVEVPAGRDVALFVAVGDVTADGLEGGLHVDVGAAEVQVDDHTGALSIDTGSGAVQIRSVRGDVVVDTGSGSV
ncbi:MAG: hypothetical protein KC645_13635, partial [Gemmatimonadetes bacterium]|nr:hypothetical protein [Gemmatimonadota bacterium]